MYISPLNLKRIPRCSKYFFYISVQAYPPTVSELGFQLTIFVLSSGVFQPIPLVHCDTDLHSIITNHWAPRPNPQYIYMYIIRGLEYYNNRMIQNNNPPLWRTSFLINKNSISRIPDVKVYLSNTSIRYKTFQIGLYCFPNSQ